MIAFHQVPVLAPSLRVERLQGPKLLFFDERQFSVLDDPAAYSVAALVDGSRTKAEVIEQAGRVVGDFAALAAFQHLELSGKLVRASREGTPEAFAFWHSVGATVPESLERLAARRVCVRSSREPSSGAPLQFAQSLRAAGIGSVELQAQDTSPEASSADLDVWLVDDYLLPELEALNKQYLGSRNRWCLLDSRDAGPMFGPCFQPGHGPCWACLAHRLRNNRPIDEYLRRSRRLNEPLTMPRAALEASEQLIFSVAALVIANVLARSDEEPASAGELLTFDFRMMRLEHHHVPRRPQCAACGDPDTLRKRAQQALHLQPVPKTSIHDGGYRQFSAAEMVARLSKHVSPRVGAVTHLDLMPDRPASHAVFVSGYLVTPSEGEDLSSCLRTCAGKGQSIEQAKASALCEALERRSGEWQGDEPRIRGSLTELGDRAVAPSTLLCFSELQYTERERLNVESSHRSQWIPERLDPMSAIDWTPAWSLAERVHRFVPFSYCYAGAPPEAGTRFCRATGNGVAAGSCIEEAILQALFELVERDAIAIWWYNRLRRPALQLTPGFGSYVDALLGEYEQQAVRVWLLDLTHDLGIPVCAAISERQIAKQRVFSAGFGCHLQPDIAVQRAVTELNQLGPGLHPATGQPLLRVPVDMDFLYPFDGASVVAYSRRWHSPDLLEDIRECVRRLNGLDVLVVDKSRPDYDVHVAQVIVPSLRHFWPRFGPGRLFDVPQRLGWLATPRGESELNPIPLML